jgi:hypothetical protein
MARKESRKKANNKKPIGGCMSSPVLKIDNPRKKKQKPKTK